MTKPRTKTNGWLRSKRIWKLFGNGQLLGTITRTSKLWALWLSDQAGDLEYIGAAGSLANAKILLALRTAS